MISKIVEYSIFLIFLFIPIALLFGTLISESSMILICLLFLFYSILTKNFNWTKNQDFKILLILYFLLIINSVFSNDLEILNENPLGIVELSGSSLPRNFGFIKYIILIFALKEIIFEKEIFLNKILIFWSFIILITVIDLYYEYVFGTNILGFTSTYPGRLVGFLGDENKIGTFIAGFLFPLFSFWIYKIFYNQNKEKVFLKKILFFLILFLTLYILLPVGQRSIVLKLIPAILFLIYFFPLINLKKKFLLFFISSALILIIFWNNQNIKSRYIDQILWPDNKKINLSETYKKSHYWKHHYSSFLVFKNNILFGVGNKNYRKTCHEFSKETNDITLNKNSSSPCAMHPHQIYFEFLSEHGFFGILFIITLTALYLKNFSFFKKNQNLYLLGSFAYFIYTFIPLVPTGSFFTSFNATLFWINYCFFYSKINKYN